MSLDQMMLAAGFDAAYDAVSRLALGFIGDSITNGYPITFKPGTYCERALSVDLAPRQVVAVNHGVNGAATNDWLSGGDNLVAAKAEFLAAGVSYVHIMIGTNDSRDGFNNDATTYQANLESTINDLVDSGYKVVLSYPIYVHVETVGSPWNAGSIARLESYQAVIDSLVDDVSVFLGDTAGWTYFENHPELFIDGVHPLEQGSEYLGGLWAVAIEALL